MSETNKKHIAFFFLLCIAVTFVSFNPLHKHTEDLNVCHNDVESVNKACHISIFHKDAKENHCKHKTHISNEKEECDQCKFISTRRYQFIFNEISLFCIEENYQLSLNTEVPIVQSQLNRCIQDRAPPFF